MEMRCGRVTLLGYALLLLALPPLGLARDLRDAATAETSHPPKKDSSNDLHGTSILVTTNSEGVTEFTVTQTNMSLTDFLQMLNNITVPLTFIPGIVTQPPAVRNRFPFHLGRSLFSAVPLTRSPPPYYPAYYPPLSSIDLSKDPMVLVAPAPGEEAGAYGAYVLPRGLSSLPQDMSKALLSPKEGMKKVGVLLFPSDVGVMGMTGRLPTRGAPFPLDAIHIRQIKVVDGEAPGAKLEDLVNAFGFARPGYYGAPWLVLSDVVDDSAEPVEAASQAREAPPAAGVGIRRPGIVIRGGQQLLHRFPPALGTIFLGKDGGVSWEVAPTGFSGAGAPPPPLPFPFIPPVPLPPPIPWFAPFALNPFALNPFSFALPPLWNPPPNPFAYPVPAASQ